MPSKIADPLAILDQLPREHLPAALARLAARVMEPSPPDDYLTPTQVARLLEAPIRYVYKHAKALGAIRVSHKKLLFRRSLVERYLRERKVV